MCFPSQTSPNHQLFCSAGINSPICQDTLAWGSNSVFENFHGSLFSSACMIQSPLSPPSLPSFLSLFSFLLSQPILILYWRIDFTHKNQAENSFSPSRPRIHTSYRMKVAAGWFPDQGSSSFGHELGWIKVTVLCVCSCGIFFLLQNS